MLIETTIFSLRDNPQTATTLLITGFLKGLPLSLSGANKKLSRLVEA